MTSDDIKAVSLDVMSELHDFCVKEGIKYTLSGGTLIGAIRHNGFIPWDDDIDVYMPRPEYEKFIHTYKGSSKYKLFTRELGNSCMVYARICEMEKTRVTSNLNYWTKEDKGLWIDIFPVDGMGDDYDAACVLVSKSRVLWSNTLRQRYTMLPFFKLPNVARMALWMWRKIGCSGHDYIEEHDKLMKTFDYDSSKFVGDLAFMQYGIKEIHSAHVFSEFIPHKFEDRQYYITAYYDELLRDTFGDYMQLPPEKDRIPRHSFNNFYWR